uniref:Uncharacterized protein n=1 Tax=Acrobeloides nanus TaxID=290746 RepID=A0A914D7X6_9BILA
LAAIDQVIKHRCSNGKQKPTVKAQDRAVQQTFATPRGVSFSSGGVKCSFDFDG